MGRRWSNLPRCLLVAMSAWAVTTAALARPPDFPSPRHASVSHVSHSMTILGRNMAVRAFVSEDSVEEVVEFYQELWQDPPVPGAPGVAYEPEAIAPWHLLTRVEDGYVLTVQVKPEGPNGSRGYLATGRLPEPGEPPAAAPVPPSLRGSEVLSNVMSDDAGKDGQTVMFANEYSVDSNVNFYRNHYTGWRKDIDQKLASNKYHALSFTRGRRQVIITIESSRDGSNIVLNSVQHDLL